MRTSAAASLRGLLATGDWLLAIDLFDVPLPQRDFGPFEVNAALVDVIYDRIVMAVPQMTTDSSEAVFETRVFVREAIGGIFRKPGSPSVTPCGFEYSARRRRVGSILRRCALGRRARSRTCRLRRRPLAAFGSSGPNPGRDGSACRRTGQDRSDLFGQ